MSKHPPSQFTPLSLDRPGRRFRFSRLETHAWGDSFRKTAHSAVAVGTGLGLVPVAIGAYATSDNPAQRRNSFGTEDRARLPRCPHCRAQGRVGTERRTEKNWPALKSVTRGSRSFSARGVRRQPPVLRQTTRAEPRRLWRRSIDCVTIRCWAPGWGCR